MKIRSLKTGVEVTIEGKSEVVNTPEAVQWLIDELTKAKKTLVENIMKDNDNSLWEA